MYIATNLNSFYFLKKKNYQFIIWFYEITLAPPPLTISLIILKCQKKKKDLKSKTKINKLKKISPTTKIIISKTKKKLSLIN